MALLGDLLLQKLRRSMVNPDRNPLKDLVEIDETEMPFRSRHDPEDRPKGGRSPVGKMFVVCAVELSSDGHPRRIRMKNIPDGASKTLHGFIGQAVEPGAHIITDGWIGYENPPANTHEAKVVSGKKARDILHWVHRVFSNLKTWAKGVFHGLRKCHLQRYLDEFVFRWNRRRHMRSGFDTLLGIGVGLGPATCRDFVEQRAWRPSFTAKTTPYKPTRRYKLIRSASQATRARFCATSTCAATGLKG